MSFSMRVHQNKYLPAGATEMHAVIKVISGDGNAATSGDGGKTIVLVVDTSGSMGDPPTKIRAARVAAQAAIELVPDGTLFALVAGSHQAECVYPKSGGHLVRADRETRAEAVGAAKRLRPDGGTAMSTWLDLVGQLVQSDPAAIRLAYLVTDGKNESEPPEALDAAIARAREVFQCDARGVGVDYDRKEVHRISAGLKGEAGGISTTEMEADFRGFMDRAIGKTIPDVHLRIFVPRACNLRFLKQVAPTIEHLHDKAVHVTESEWDYGTGAWAGNEWRDYHVCVEVPPGEVVDDDLDDDDDDDTQVAKVSLVIGRDTLAQGEVLAVWTDDVFRSTRIEPEVGRYTNREEQAVVTQEGLTALEQGDTATAAVKLGRAVQLASEAGDDDTLRGLSKLVEIDDAATGAVRVRRTVDAKDINDVFWGSFRTDPVHKTGTSVNPDERK